jgi:NOL1/NOP2/sun family putative RNA methylase
MEINLLQRYGELTKASEEEILAATAKKCIRVNTLRTESKELLRRLNKKGVLLRKIPYLQNGYEYKAKFSLGATPEYLQGHYYLQEAASQIPVEVLNPKPGSKVLDMAAAPGSKTTQIGQLMKNEGTIIALDNNATRINALTSNIERCGVTNCIVYKKDGRFGFDVAKDFDYILLDAPCSGNYCIEENYFENRSMADIKERAKLQRELLKSARLSLKKGGMLVYSTCSLEPEENEENVEWLLKNYPDMKQVSTGLSIGEEGIKQPLSRRLWPHKTRTQGFFIAKFEKS